MTTKIEIGTKFLVCGHEELMDKGWWEDDEINVHSEGNYYHDDFQACSITFKMIRENEGKTLTVTGYDPFLDKTLASRTWFTVAENPYVWPVSTFLRVSHHTCEEGMTPIDGWFICKICGDNLKEIKG